MIFLTSPRLSFRPWTEPDLPLAFALWGDPEVGRYLGGALSHEAAKARLQLEMERQRTLGLQYWPVFERETEEFAGCAGLRPFTTSSASASSGFTLRAALEQAHGGGGCPCRHRICFNELRLDALTAGHNPQNLHSHALLIRLGFVYTHTEPWGPLNIEHPFYRLATGKARSGGADGHV